MDIEYHYGVVEIRIPRAVKESVVSSDKNQLFVMCTFYEQC